MYNFSLVLWTYRPTPFESLFRVLSSPCLTDLIFPATYYLRKESVVLTNPKDLDLSLVPEEHLLGETGGGHITLFPKNGIKFSASIYTTNTIAPSSLVFQFSEDQINSQVITVSRIQTLLINLVPQIQCSQAFVYNTELAKIPDQEHGGVRYIQPKYCRAPNGNLYRLEIDWISYFGSEFLDYVGRNRFDQLKTISRKEEIFGGVLVILQEEPIDNLNANQITRKKEAEEELGFDELAREI